MLRAAIAGYGFIADYHVRALQRLPNVEVTTVYGRDAAKRKAFAAKYGIPIDEPLDAIGEYGEHILVVALPNALHAPVAIRALERGTHVLVEKPMAMNAAEAATMIEAARRADRLLFVGHMWRFDREVLWMRQQAAATGPLGRITKTKSYGVHTLWGPSGWFADPALAGGGALIDMGIHAVDTTRFLLGDPAPVRVFATLGTHYTDGPLDDDGVVMITWDNGVTSLIESGWQHAWMDGPEAATQLFGTLGYGRVFPTALHVREGDQLKQREVTFPIRDEHCDQHAFDAQMAHVVGRIVNGDHRLDSANSGRETLAIVDAAYLSAQTGDAISMNKDTP